MLVDVPDRLVSISLLEVIMQDRVDVAKFLLQITKPQFISRIWMECAH